MSEEQRETRSGPPTGGSTSSPSFYEAPGRDPIYGWRSLSISEAMKTEGQQGNWYLCIENWRLVAQWLGAIPKFIGRREASQLKIRSFS